MYVCRTFPGHPSMDESGRCSLRRILAAYARHNPAVGYCQVRGGTLRPTLHQAACMSHAAEHGRRGQQENHPACLCDVMRAALAAAALQVMRGRGTDIGAAGVNPVAPRSQVDPALPTAPPKPLQGMNFIAACFGLFMEEEAAFWCLAAVVEDLLPGYFDQRMVAPQVGGPGSWVLAMVPCSPEARAMQHAMRQELATASAGLQSPAESGGAGTACSGWGNAGHTGHRKCAAAPAPCPLQVDQRVFAHLLEANFPTVMAHLRALEARARRLPRCGLRMPGWRLLAQLCSMCLASPQLARRGLHPAQATLLRAIDSTFGTFSCPPDPPARRWTSPACACTGGSACS